LQLRPARLPRRRTRDALPTVTPAAKPRLTDCDIILVNSSAGKDSQATLDLVAGAAREAGVLDRLVVAHTDLGDAEWDGVPQLAAEHAAHYGLRFEIARRAHDGTVETRTGRWLPMLLRPSGRGVRK